MKNFDLRDLDAFVAVARTRNFRRAATEQSVSVSSLSQRLRDMEERLGVRLEPEALAASLLGSGLVLVGIVDREGPVDRKGVFGIGHQQGRRLRHGRQCAVDGFAIVELDLGFDIAAENLRSRQRLDDADEIARPVQPALDEPVDAGEAQLQADDACCGRFVVGVAPAAGSAANSVAGSAGKSSFPAKLAACPKPVPAALKLPPAFAAKSTLLTTRLSA